MNSSVPNKATSPEEQLGVILDVSESRSSGTAQEIERALLDQIRSQEGERSIRLILTHDGVVSDTEIAPGEEIDPDSFRRSKSGLHPLSHIQEHRGRTGAVIFVNSYAETTPMLAPNIPLLWVPRDLYSVEKDFGSVVPERMARFLDLPATARALPPADHQYSVGMVRPPSSPVRLPTPLPDSLYRDDSSFTEASLPGIGEPQVSRIYRKQMKRLLQQLLDGNALSDFDSHVALEEMDSLWLRGHLPPEGLVQKIREHALTDSAAQVALLYLRLPHPRISADDIYKIGKRHWHNKPLLAEMLLHPMSPERLIDDVMADPYLRHEPIIRRSLSKNPSARARKEIQDLMFEAGSALELLRLLEVVPTERFSEMCQRMLEDHSFARDQSLKDVLRQARDSQVSALSQADWARFLSEPNQEIRLLALSRMGSIASGCRSEEAPSRSLPKR